MAISSDFLDDKKDYDKRVKYLLELGIEPTPFNGNTISGQYFDYNNEFAGYSRLNLPFNVMQYGTWKAKDAKDINSGFFSLLHNNFADASQSELIQLTERYIKESKLIADKYEAIDLYQAQYWAVHSKWLGDVLHELKTFSNAENLKILPKDIAFRLIARKHHEFKIDIDAVIKRINTHVKIEVEQLKAKINGRLMRFPDRAKLIFDEYETDLDAIYKDLKFVFSKSLFDDNGDFIKEKFYKELQMVYAYPNANLDDFINKGIHQLVTMAKIEALGQLKGTKDNGSSEVQKNNFNPDTSIKRVKEHFLPLVDNGYLDDGKFEKFIELAFVKLEKPKELIELKSMPMPKSKFIKYFVQYYQDVSGKPKGRAEIFMHLCKDYFKGFDKLSLTNWTK